MAATYPVKMVKKHNGSAAWFTEDTVEGTTQTYYAGNIVKVAASGAVQTISTADATSILGIAQTDSTAVTSTKAIVEIIEPGDIIEMTLVNGSATPVTAALSDLYKKYGLYYGSGDSFLDQGSATFAQIVGIVKDKNGAYTSRVWCTPIATTLTVATGL